MMDFLNRYKITLIVLILGVGAFVAYQNYYVPSLNIDPLVSEGQVAGSIVGQEIISLLGELESIKLDVTIFEKESFRSLIDFGQTINSEPVGRGNPFAPIGVETGFSNGIAEPIVNEDNSISNIINTGVSSE